MALTRASNPALSWGSVHWSSFRLRDCTAPVRANAATGGTGCATGFLPARGTTELTTNESVGLRGSRLRGERWRIRDTRHLRSHAWPRTLFPMGGATNIRAARPEAGRRDGAVASFGLIPASKHPIPASIRPHRGPVGYRDSRVNEARWSQLGPSSPATLSRIGLPFLHRERGSRLRGNDRAALYLSRSLVTLASPVQWGMKASCGRSAAKAKGREHQPPPFFCRCSRSP